MLVALALVACREPLSGPSGGPVTLTIDPPTATLGFGQTLAVDLRVADRFGMPVSDLPVEWRSSDERVATVSREGVVTPVSEGTVTITAAVRTQAASMSVTVVESSLLPVAQIQIVPDSAAVAVQDSILLVASLFDAAGASIRGRLIRWDAIGFPPKFSIRQDGWAVVHSRAGRRILVTATAEGHVDTAVIRTILAPGPAALVGR